MSKEYLIKVLKNATNILSGISFCLVLITIFIPIPETVKSSLVSIFVFVSIFYATYRVYASEVKTNKGNLSLKTNSTSTSHAGMTGDGMILKSEIAIVSDSELINSTVQNYSFEKPSLEVVHINKDLIDEESIKLDITSNDFSRFPVDVDPNKRLRFNIKITMKIKSNNLRSFASDLNHLGSYNFKM